MLRQFSRMERTRNWLIIGFALLMGLSLIVFNVARNPVSANAAINTEVLANVNGDEVTVGDLNLLKENYRNMFGGQISLAQLGGDERFLDGLIRDKVVAQEAARLNLTPSDAEVAAEIRKSAGGSKIDVAQYKENVTAKFGSVERYERGVRESLAAQKLRAFVTAGVRVSDEEVQADYKRKNTSLDLVYVPVTADKLAARVQPSDEDLQKYFEGHKVDFQFLEPQKKVRYLFIDQAKAGAKLNISDADLRANYDQLKPENKQAGVRVQQIVLRVAHPDLDAQVLAKANSLVQQARGDAGGEVTEARFAELARGNSEDPATAKNGGALPGPVRKSINVKSDDPLQQTLDMTPGQISEPIKYRNAYYILRRGDVVPKSFEDAKPELLVSQRNTRAYKIAADLAARAVQRVKETKNLEQVTQELASEANMTPAEMLKETPLIKPQDDVPGIGSSPQFEAAIKPLENPGDVGDRVAIKNGFAVPMLIEKRPERVPEFSEVRDKVVQRVKEVKAREQLEQTARDLANNAGGANNLKAAAEKLGLEVQTADKYKLGTPLGAAGTSPAADEAIFNLREGEVTKTPIKIGDSWVIIGAKKRTEADLAEFAKQRDQLTQAALSTKQNDVLEDYINAISTRLKQDGKIKIYKDVLARAADDEDVAAPPARPRRLPLPPPGS